MASPEIPGCPWVSRGKYYDHHSPPPTGFTTINSSVPLFGNITMIAPNIMTSIRNNRKIDITQF